MKLTATEYRSFFGGTRDSITAKCRNGELNACKNEKGIWIIEVDIPQKAYDAKMEAMELRAIADAKWRELQKIEMKIDNLGKLYIDYIVENN